MGLTNYIAAGAVLGMLAAPAALYAQDPFEQARVCRNDYEVRKRLCFEPGVTPDDLSRCNQEAKKEYASCTRQSSGARTTSLTMGLLQNRWLTEWPFLPDGQKPCYNGTKVNVAFTDPTFGFPAEQQRFILTIMRALKNQGYNPADVRSYAHPGTVGKIRVEYKGKKEGEEKGGLPTVVITLVNEGERERIDLQSAHIFSGVRGFDHNELSDFVTTAVPPVCAPEKKNEQGQTGATGTERGQK